MSVTIRYFGSLRDMSDLTQLKEDLVDIAQTSEWPSEEVDGVFSSLRSPVARGKSAESAVQTINPPLTLNGMKLIVHPQTDPLWFTFNPEGEITRLSYYAVDYYIGKKPNDPVSRKFEFVHQTQASIQTSVGGPELHKLVIKLLDYVKGRYIPDLTVMDDSGYWENRDAASLKKLMDSI
jgi:hypothetical protein